MTTYQDLQWSTLASIPETSGVGIQLPLDELPGYPALRGRSGDLLIIQLKSGIGTTAKRQSTLKSLGLRGVRSSSLRSSREPGILGYIRTVRDLIGVVELDGIVYKSAVLNTKAAEAQYEKIEYGSNTRPGALVRNSNGEYFIFESDRNGLLLNWSTGLSAAECLERFESLFAGSDLLLEHRSGDRASMVSVTANGEPTHSTISPESHALRHGGSIGDEFQIDASNLVVDMPTSEAIDLIRRRDLSIVSARIAYKGVFMTWHRPYPRFIDSDREMAEAGVYLNGLSRLTEARKFVREAGRSRFFAEADVTILVRERGNPKHIRI